MTDRTDSLRRKYQLGVWVTTVYTITNPNAFKGSTIPVHVLLTTLPHTEFK
jgi:hypothetical protein